MNLERYIIVSMFIHALLFWALGNVLPGATRVPQVFNVDILPPLQERATVPPVPEKKTQPAQNPRENREVIVPKPHRRPPEKNIFPDSMTGGDSHSRKPEKGHQWQSETTVKSSGGGNASGKDSAPYVLPPSALFDRGTIEKFARKGTPPLDRGLTFDAAEFRHRGYMRMLREKIEDIWKYPEEAARRGISGDLYIKFVINRDGSLAEVRLIRTSGYRALDEAAISALKKAEPYWPLPDDWEKDTLEIKGHFIYVFGRTFVM